MTAALSSRTGAVLEAKIRNRWRADCLREVPAAIRFLSVEPLIDDPAELDLTDIDWVIGGGALAKATLVRRGTV